MLNNLPSDLPIDCMGKPWKSHNIDEIDWGHWSTETKSANFPRGTRGPLVLLLIAIWPCSGPWVRLFNTILTNRFTVPDQLLILSFFIVKCRTFEVCGHILVRTIISEEFRFVTRMEVRNHLVFQYMWELPIIYGNFSGSFETLLNILNSLTSYDNSFSDSQDV